MARRKRKKGEPEMDPEERVDYSSFNLSKYKKKGRWNIVGALDCLLQLSKNSELCDEFWSVAASPLKYRWRTRYGQNGDSVANCTANRPRYHAD